MPRLNTKTSEEKEKIAPRKRAVRRVATKDETETVRRPRAPRKVLSTPKVEEGEQVIRKAPTKFTAEATNRTQKRNRILLGTAFVAIVVMVAAWIGTTDAGQINVTARIDEQNKNQPATTETIDGVETVTVPVQNTPPAAISGLRGRGVGTPDVVAEVVPESPTTEATSTEEIATSTEVVAVENPDTVKSETAENVVSETVTQ